MKQLILILALCLPSWAQYVTITGTVLDPSGTAYAAGSGRALLVSGNGSGSQSWSFSPGNNINPVVVITTLTSTGTFSIQLANTSLVLPQAAQPKWQFQFCNSDASICFTMTPMALTSSQDISSTIQLQAAFLPSTGSGGGGTGPNAGQVKLGQGLPATMPLDGVGLTVGTSVTPYQFEFPSSSGSGLLNLTDTLEADGHHVRGAFVAFPIPCDPALGNSVKVSGTTFSCVALVPVLTGVNIISHASVAGIEVDVPSGTKYFRLINDGSLGSFKLQVWNGAAFVSMVNGSANQNLLALDALDATGTIRLGQISGAPTDTYGLLTANAGATIVGRTRQSTITTFADGATTPTVAAGNIFKTANTNPTTITAFSNGVAGQTIRIIFTDANTTVTDGGTIKLQGAANFVSSADDTMTLIWDGASWYELSRSVN